MSLSQRQVYQWYSVLRHEFKECGYWQVLGLAMYSLGIVVARHSNVRHVAEGLLCMGRYETVRRRLERLIANKRLDRVTFCRAWSRWMLRYAGKQPILLVDETKLGNRLSVMVVGLAVGRACIPLAWRCYHPKAWPCGQVDLIQQLLSIVAEGLRPDQCPMVQADRGIGTSPRLIRYIRQQGWDVLMRVQGQTRLRTMRGREMRLDQLVKPGEAWTGQAFVFKKDGWLLMRVEVVWLAGYGFPWCLVTTLPAQSGLLYAVRFWQEAGFRDLKSDGWQWQVSRVWQPDHAERLLLVMSIAYSLVISWGWSVHACPDLRYQFIASNDQLSIFRTGLRFARHALMMPPYLSLSGFSVPPPATHTYDFLSLSWTIDPMTWATCVLLVLIHFLVSYPP